MRASQTPSSAQSPRGQQLNVKVGRTVSLVREPGGEVELVFRSNRNHHTHILAISGQHVAILAAVIYFVLRGFAVPLAARVPATLVLIWLYILIAGAPPSAIRAGVVATLVLVAQLLGRQLSPV